VDRTIGSEGDCGMDEKIKISYYGPHFGEEPELVGRNGSGTIFFSGCNLLCDFCQNSEISHFKSGNYYSVEDLSGIILGLQEIGCTNINLVSPTHFSVSIVNAILMAKQEGLHIPVVYNSSGYEKKETLKMMEEVIDIYMPDLKFTNALITIGNKKINASKEFCNAEDYFEFASGAIIEMYRQKGDLVVRNGIAKRGLLIRHLIMPNMMANTREIIDFVAENIGVNTYLNLMDQYRPEYKAKNYDIINRRACNAEIQTSIDYAKSRGFTRPDWLYS
jgi:putative pyruvate formate lyase activating enzyme